MRLTTKSRYGTKLLLDIALHSEDGPVRVCDISRRQGISVKYLEKLIRTLKNGGYIESKRGPRGGHLIAMPLDAISVGAIVRILEGEHPLAICGDDDPHAGDESCLTRRIWMEAGRAMFEKLDSITFAQLVEEARKCTKTHCCLRDAPARRNA
ncbi:Rrf2 family protein [Desulfobaculum xiamenense]|uniref:Rrf2 family protein n=1 Tax=Desulfobaculum xiamenense TaxID=995050 RepID=A0A846QPR5_9BACT|nr:Rrf2 family transcriptional regulator [Desulfobaculum xiamenense]NJB68492.1 Rrf2 family protein [Desulfobaculum xiamenense]